MKAWDVAFLGVALQLGACFTSDARPTVQARAASDLQCEPQDVEVSEVSECTYQALGCGKQATYVVQSHYRDSAVCCPLSGCYATLDSAVTKQAPSPRPEQQSKAARSCDSLPDDESKLYKRGKKLITPYIDPPDLRANQSDVGEDDLRAGVTCLERVLLLSPSHARAMWLRAKALQRLGEHARAVSAFKAAYSAQPDNRDVAYEYVFELLATKAFKEAVGVAERATREHPQDAELFTHLALAHLLNADPEQAKQAVEHALSLDPAATQAKALRRRIDEVVAGQPLPRSLEDLGRGGG